MEKRWVRKSLSPCAMLVIPKPKKDGLWRICNDYRAINITLRWVFDLGGPSKIWVEFSPNKGEW